MNIRDLLMPLEEYLEKSAPVEQSEYMDYSYAISKNGKSQLFYFGSGHSNDPDNPQNAKIKRHWKLFLQDSIGRERVAMVERGVKKIPDNEVGAIKAQGEGGLLTYLANRDGVDVVSPEPRRIEELQGLLDAGYRQQEIEYYYFAGSVVRWHRVKDQSSFEEFAKQHFQNRPPFWVIDSLATMREIHKDLFGGELDENEVTFFSAITKPRFGATVINHIARDSGLIRDAHIVQQIKNSWDQGKCIFAVFGAGHAIRQEPALRTLLS
jgi:hypothetical protein